MGISYEIDEKNKFLGEMINLIMRCVESVTYSFKINDRVVDDVRPSRGLLQGDPLSPYRGIHITQDAPIILHLFFVDDSLVFFKSTT